MTSARGGSYPGSASRRDRLAGHSWFAAGRCRRQAPRTSASEGPPTRGPAPRRLLSVHCCFPLITGLTTNVTWTSRVVRDQHSREAVRFWGAPPPLWRESPGGQPPGSPGKAARTCGFSTHPRPHARLSAPRRSWGGLRAPRATQDAFIPGSVIQPCPWARNVEEAPLAPKAPHKPRPPPRGLEPTLEVAFQSELGR